MSKIEDRAEELFRMGYNCSQSVAAAFCEQFHMDPDTVLKLSCPFGGGLGRMRYVCGAVSGMIFLCGLRYSTGKPGDIENRARIYGIVREMTAEFAAEAGSITCSELLAGKIPKNEGARPEERTDEYYRKRPCANMVRLAAQIAGRYLT